MERVYVGPAWSWSTLKLAGSADFTIRGKGSRSLVSNSLMFCFWLPERYAQGNHMGSYVGSRELGLIKKGSTIRASCLVSPRDFVGMGSHLILSTFLALDNGYPKVRLAQ